MPESETEPTIASVVTLLAPLQQNDYQKLTNIKNQKDSEIVDIDRRVKFGLAQRSCHIVRLNFIQLENEYEITSSTLRHKAFSISNGYIEKFNSKKLNGI